MSCYFTSDMPVVPNLRLLPHFDFIVQFGGGWERPIWIWDKDLLPGERCSRTREDLGPKFMKLDSEDSGHISIQIPWHILHSPITKQHVSSCLQLSLKSLNGGIYKPLWRKNTHTHTHTHTHGSTETSKQFLLLAFKSIIYLNNSRSWASSFCPLVTPLLLQFSQSPPYFIKSYTCQT